jgi:hypothetical protein
MFFHRKLGSGRKTDSALAIILLGVCLLTHTAVDARKPQAKVDWIKFENGKLVYGTDEHGNRIPDFSSVGYEGGGVPIPDIRVRATIEPVAGEKDSTRRIEQAIEELAKQPVDKDGFRGALLLRAGSYPIAGTVRVNASGIVLRGEGTGEHGTILVAEGAPHTLVRLGGVGGWEHAGAAHAILDNYVPIGTTTITVEDADEFKPGDRVVIEWAMDAPFIHAIGMDSIPPRKNGGEIKQWPVGMALRFDRRIVNVEPATGGRRLTLDAPLTTPMVPSEAHVWRYKFPRRVDHVGIENLEGYGKAFENAGSSAPPAINAGDCEQPEENAEDDEGASAAPRAPAGPCTAPVLQWAAGRSYFNSVFVSFGSVENAWMRKMTVAHFSGIVAIGQYARAVTVTDVEGDHIDTEFTHAPPQAFSIDGQQSLVENCSVTGKINHVWTTQARVAGPDVFRSCTAKGQTLDAGPHQRWAAGVLYDNLHIQGPILVHNRSNMGTGHGWAGSATVLWNCEAEKYYVESPPVAYNWAFGTKGSVERAEDGQVISPGKHVEPESLYEEQMKERQRK